MRPSINRRIYDPWIPAPKGSGRTFGGYRNPSDVERLGSELRRVRRLVVVAAIRDARRIIGKVLR